jgi:hypothetical protein
VAKRGRKPFVPTQVQRQQVEAMVAYGLPLDALCTLLVNPETGKPLSFKTFRKNFGTEIALGAHKANARVAESIFQQAVGSPAIYDQNGRCIRNPIPPNITAAIFWLKARAGWRDRDPTPVENRDGGAISNTAPAVSGDGEVRFTINIGEWPGDKQIDLSPPVDVSGAIDGDVRAEGQVREPGTPLSD